MADGISISTYRSGLKHSVVMAVIAGLHMITGFLPQVLLVNKLGIGLFTDAYLMAVSINQVIVKLFRVGTFPKIFLMVLADDFNSREKTEKHLNIFLAQFL